MALEQVLGNNGLYGFEVGLAHDTRDNNSWPPKATYFAVSFEQVIGTYTYPHVEAWSSRRYFKLSERADGTGPARAESSATGRGSPATTRRSTIATSPAASPRSAASSSAASRPSIRPRAWLVGGDFELLNSVEYMFPITADDMLRGVFFVDGGTVEPTVSQWTDKYRVAAGFGLRIAMPMMGPAPIALDFGFPIVKEPGDQTQVFSFFRGLSR